MKSMIEGQQLRTSFPLMRRRGVALMAAVVTLVIISLMMSAIAWQMVASGRMLQHREYELQAASLAQAGVEWAAAKLLERPDSYRGETLQLIELSSVTIEVSDAPNLPHAYRVTCEARYPTDLVAVVSRKQTRLFQRVVDAEEVRLECLASNEDGSEVRIAK
jgi:hypothetical protein